MGDLRSSFRLIVPRLVESGHRVVTLDLRGHGDSDTSFTSFDDEALATDIEALFEHLGEPAVVVGNSMGAGAAVITAAKRPELIAGLVLLGAFVRNPPVGAFMKGVFRVITARPWVAGVWKAYLPTLYSGAKPADFEDYRSAVHTAMKRPGHAAAFSRTATTTHAPAEAAAPGVRAPALVIMGAQDPDFKDPAAEAAWIATQFEAQTVVLDDCGHYPQSQQATAVLAAVVPFLAKVTHA
jgi:pimeloyl-ACP methyl ester carboxylesterase